MPPTSKRNVRTELNEQLKLTEIVGRRPLRIELDPRSLARLRQQMNLGQPEFYRGLRVVERDSRRRIVTVCTREAYSSSGRDQEMSVGEMREHYAKEAAGSYARRCWAKRCCAYYGAGALENVSQWQRDSYSRMHNDKEPTK